jgi:hypothetical protein
MPAPQGNSPYLARASLSRLRGHTQTNTHSHIHSVGLLRTSDQPDAETSTSQHTTLTTDRHPCPGRIRTHNRNKRATADQRLRPRGHWDRQENRSTRWKKIYPTVILRTTNSI